jgi:hypothetical protein
MALEMVLNELSLIPAENVHNARQWMTTLVHTVQAAVARKVSRVVRTQSAIFDVYLASDYPVRRWLNDREVDLEEQRYLLTLTTKTPFWDDVPGLYDRVLASEYRCEGRPALGLGVASLLDSLAVSLPSEQCWDSALLHVAAEFVVDDQDLSIEETSIAVPHASRAGHIDEHHEWIESRLYGDVESGHDLWDRKSELFPRLTFCGSAMDQIRDLNWIMLKSVMRHLIDLERYCEGWQNGGFDPRDSIPHATPETDTTLARYGDERTFRCPDGTYRVFSWHVRLTPDAWRLHFFPGPQVGQIIVGYIGPKLPGVRCH